MAAFWSRGIVNYPTHCKVWGFEGIIIMHSIGFYANCDEAIHNIIKDYIDKTYTDAFKYFIELMKHDFESERV